MLAFFRYLCYNLSHMATKLPTVAIIGRANAGKSSLFNRMVRSQQAIVAREAGTTRDNVVGKVTYRRNPSSPDKRVARESEHQEESAEQIFTDAESQRQDPSLATYVERPEAERTTGAGSADDMLDLAFFMRGSKGKIPVDQCSLLPEPMMRLALAIRDLLQTKPLTARNLKTLLIRSDQQGNCVWQLYLKDELPDIITPAEAAALPASGGELIYSDPRSRPHRYHTQRAIPLRDRRILPGQYPGLRASAARYERMGTNGGLLWRSGHE
jgi:hypothetical protein